MLFHRHVCLSNLKHAPSRKLPLTAHTTVFSHLNMVTMTSCHSIEMTPLLILLAPCFTALSNPQSSFYIKGTSHYSSKGKGAEDLGLNKVKFRRSSLITFDDFRVPPLPPLSSLSKQILDFSAPPPPPQPRPQSFRRFQWSPLLGSQLRLPSTPEAINNDRSLTIIPRAWMGS